MGPHPIPSIRSHALSAQAPTRRPPPSIRSRALAPGPPPALRALARPQAPRRSSSLVLVLPGEGPFRLLPSWASTKRSLVSEGGQGAFSAVGLCGVPAVALPAQVGAVAAGCPPRSGASPQGHFLGSMQGRAAPVSTRKASYTSTCAGAWWPDSEVRVGR